MVEAPLDRLRGIMARLRDPERGCEWDRAQTFASIAPYTIEEAYEVADACARNDVGELKDELGDLLLQVVFHARIAEEMGAFDFDAVAAAIADKLERRHPHVFGDAVVDEHDFWEAIKADERAAKPDRSALAGIALALPALLRAEKLQKRAARAGLSPPATHEGQDLFATPMAELANASRDAQSAAIGARLFAVVEQARMLDVDPEAALRETNVVFERRMRAEEAARDNIGVPEADSGPAALPA